MGWEREFAQKAAWTDMRLLLVEILFINISRDDSGPAHCNITHEKQSTTLDFEFHLPLGPVTQQLTLCP